MQAVLAGEADFRTAFKGMEGSGFVLALLHSLLSKLSANLALQVRRGATGRVWGGSEHKRQLKP